MSRTRDVIQEIAAVRQRRRFGSAISELPLRLLTIEHTFRTYDKSNPELSRYFPVALIACLEGYIRLAIKDLIDAGEPYLTNAESLSSSIKLDFSVVRAVHGKHVTVGELVSHGLPISRLEHIDAALSGLLGKSFLRELRVTTDRWSHEVKGEPATPILAEPDSVFADVARTFELRHIISHELASAYEIKIEEISRCFESCVLFLRAADEYVSNTLHPGAPLTQTDMNIAAGEELEAAEQRLAALVSDLKSRFDPDELSAFEDVQSKWQVYCDAWAGFQAGERSTGGTIWPLIYASTAQEMVEKRIKELMDYKNGRDSM